ncbi:MAG: Gfo/Idh/MocA family oxidoreductase [Alphaproteobacteria bacterium]
MGKLRTAVVGVGRFGRFHAEKYARIQGSELVAVADVDRARAKEVAGKYGVSPVFDFRDLLGRVDVVSIAVPTALHYEVAKPFLENGVHVLVEKPITDDLAKADELIRLAKDKGVTLQVGHVERFSSVRLGVEEIIDDPVFIECNRLMPFRPASVDVDVILDLMIHDIDLILDIVKAPVIKVDAVGTPVLTDDVDIANARIEFETGCIANITASRVSTKSERKIRIFQRQAYISLDFLNNKVAIANSRDGKPFPGLSGITVDERSFEEGDKLEREIEAFLQAVARGTAPPVTGEDSRRALETAFMINRSLRSRSGLGGKTTAPRRRGGG